MCYDYKCKKDIYALCYIQENNLQRQEPQVANGNLTIWRGVLIDSVKKSGSV